MYDPKVPVENMPNKYGYLFFQERSMHVQVQYVGGGGGITGTQGGQNIQYSQTQIFRQLKLPPRRSTLAYLNLTTNGLERHTWSKGGGGVGVKGRDCMGR